MLEGISKGVEVRKRGCERERQGVLQGLCDVVLVIYLMISSMRVY